MSKVSLSPTPPGESRAIGYYVHRVASRTLITDQAKQPLSKLRHRGEKDDAMSACGGAWLTDDKRWERKQLIGELINCKSL